MRLLYLQIFLLTFNTAFSQTEYKELKKTFKSFAIGDTIRIPFGISKSGGQNYFTVWSNRTDETKFECIVEGEIVNKSSKKNAYLLKIKVIEMCKGLEQAILNNENIGIGSTFEHNMKYFKIIIDRN